MPPTATLPMHPSPALVTLSVVVATLASASAFAVAGRVAVAPTPQVRTRWLAGALLAMGAGAWALHFTGILSAAATLERRPPLVVLSALLAWVPAAAVLLTRLGLERAARRVRSPSLVWSLSAVTAATMSLAVAGMHYAAVRLHPTPGIAQRAMPMSGGWLVAGIAATAAAIVGFTHLIAWVDRPVSRASRPPLVAGTRLRSIFARIPDAVLTFDARGLVESINPAAAALFGLDEGWAGWVHVRELLPEIDAMELGAGPGPTETGARAVETTGRRIDGAVVRVDVALARTDCSNDVLHTAVIRRATGSGPASPSGRATSVVRSRAS